MPPLACLCSTLSDLAIVPMGADDLDQRVFATIERVVDKGDDCWWLYLSRCEACGQHWIVAQEDRIYDVFVLTRIDISGADAIMSDGVWPEEFLFYERVLAGCRRLVAPPRFLEPFAYSLQFTAEDLRRDRPGITPREIAWLLGLSPGHAQMLYWKVRLLGAGRLPG